MVVSGRWKFLYQNKHLLIFFTTLFQDGTLKNGDHLLAVGEVRLWGMGAEQVRYKFFGSSDFKMKSRPY